MSGLPAFPSSFFSGTPQNSQQLIEAILYLPLLPLVGINQIAISAQEQLAGQSGAIPIIF
jgi:hypothetical protein